MVGGVFLGFFFFSHARIKTLGEEQNDWAQGKYSLGSAKCATLLMAPSSSSPGSKPVAAAACICLPHESLGGAEAHTYFGKAMASAEIRGGPIITVITADRVGADARRGRVPAVTLHPHVTPGCSRIAAVIWCGKKKRGAGSERFEL